MSKVITIMLFEDEDRWHNFIADIIQDLQREREMYKIRYVSGKTLDEAKRLFHEQRPDVIISDVYIQEPSLPETVKEQTDLFVETMNDLCTDEGPIKDKNLKTLSDLEDAGYEMGKYYRRGGLDFLDHVRNSKRNILFILWSSKIFCAASRLKHVARMHRGPDLIIPKPPVGSSDDPELRDRLRQAVDAVASDMWPELRDIVPWLKIILS